MSEQDPHAPTTAGPEPEATGVSSEQESPPAEAFAAPAEPFAAPAPAPAPAWPVDPEERPEVLVGAAFAGGLLAALVLKRITRGGR